MRFGLWLVGGQQCRVLPERVTYGSDRTGATNIVRAHAANNRPQRWDRLPWLIKDIRARRNPLWHVHAARRAGPVFKVSSCKVGLCDNSDRENFGGPGDDMQTTRSHNKLILPYKH